MNFSECKLVFQFSFFNPNCQNEILHFNSISMRYVNFKNTIFQVLGKYISTQFFVLVCKNR